MRIREMDFPDQGSSSEMIEMKQTSNPFNVLLKQMLKEKIQVIGTGQYYYYFSSIVDRYVGIQRTESLVLIRTEGRVFTENKWRMKTRKDQNKKLTNKLSILIIKILDLLNNHNQALSRSFAQPQSGLGDIAVQIRSPPEGIGKGATRTTSKELIETLMVQMLPTFE